MAVVPLFAPMNTPKDAQRAYRLHQSAAASRNIPFTLTLQEWWHLWAPHWEHRKEQRLQMCRTKDLGGYVQGNVRIDTQRNNAAERAPESYARSSYDLRLLPGATLPQRLNRLEVRALRCALRATDHNASAAARKLGITFRQMRYALKKHTRLAVLFEAASLCDMK